MNLSQQHCGPCHTGAPPLSAEAARALLEKLKEWTISEDGKWLLKAYTFRNFVQALAFTNKVGEIAEAEGHHPDLMLGWGYVNIKLQTHAAGGLHENDFILAAKIDAL